MCVLFVLLLYSYSLNSYSPISFTFAIDSSDDLFGMHVHPRLRYDLGPGRVDTHRRDVPYTYEGEAGCAGYG